MQLTLDHSALKDLLEKHLARLEASWPTGPPADWARGFLRNFRNEDLSTVCLIGAEKLSASLADDKRHSAAISKPDIFVTVSTFPCSLDEARRLFYPHGYFGYLDAALNASRDDSPNSHYVHVQFFSDRRFFWVQFTLFPNKKVLGFDPLFSLPVDLLTVEEKRKVGLT